ncbi:uncharacterized protein F4822DRAFT_120834 [Hypoxylon trugodes]|uniref:uncharacterized protein n=1 Tax=Hypoxylon trugodes TaxID=326681 RepID=UPI00219EE224|nr:uncharacterized protein F4822DRAFT_120834 [Hypoxylon trugodes]KAI1392237.1 hypothetical protein F4822DRAFT_120834 [Hypoxylon trugodes]
MASRIPPLLDPYLRLPPETSFILLSGVLGSTTNWLVLRYLHSLLSTATKEESLDSSRVDGVSVIFASFLRDYAFWKENAGKLGLDLDGLSRKGRFVFVDGLINLFHESHGRIPGRSLGDHTGRKVLSSATLQHFYTKMQDAATQIQRSAPEQKTVLLVDQMDLLLAASGDDITSQGLRETLLGIREKVHLSVVTLSIDEPLVSSQTTPLEKEHAAFALSLAHDAQLVISLRMLDTGAARDVSGVLRVTPGGGRSSVDGAAVEDQELLYFVAADGGVRVFERG